MNNHSTIQEKLDRLLSQRNLLLIQSKNLEKDIKEKQKLLNNIDKAICEHSGAIEILSEIIKEENATEEEKPKENATEEEKPKIEKKL
ncbi:MAG: hypothetical protein M0R03_14470 [Novosphingobium sp.]|nr:hypothetical protein [Novosphingobium sp.]